MTEDDLRLLTLLRRAQTLALALARLRAGDHAGAVVLLTLAEQLAARQEARARPA